MRQVTFSALMEKLASMPNEIESAVYDALVKSAVEVHKTAVRKFGQYQPQRGPFEAWAVLAPETIQRKLAAGSTGHDPLIGHSTGKQNSLYPVSLRQSLAMDVSRAYLVAQVGTNDPIGEWQEYGTTRGIPPRPFLRPALYQNETFIREITQEALGLSMAELFR